YSSVADMAKLIGFELGAYPPRGGPDAGPVRRSSVRESHEGVMIHELSVWLRDQPADGEPLVGASAPATGYGWRVFQDCDFGRYLGHNGGTPGYSSNVALAPDLGIGAIALTNRRNVNPGPFVGRVLRHLAKSAQLAPRVPSKQLAKRFAPAMDRLLALYQHWDDATYEAMLAPGRRRIPSER